MTKELLRVLLLVTLIWKRRHAQIACVIPFFISPRWLPTDWRIKSKQLVRATSYLLPYWSFNWKSHHFLHIPSPQPSETSDHFWNSPELLTSLSICQYWHSIPEPPPKTMFPLSSSTWWRPIYPSWTSSNVTSPWSPDRLRQLVSPLPLSLFDYLSHCIKVICI